VSLRNKKINLLEQSIKESVCNALQKDQLYVLVQWTIKIMDLDIVNSIFLVDKLWSEIMSHVMFRVKGWVGGLTLFSKTLTFQLIIG